MLNDPLTHNPSWPVRVERLKVKARGLGLTEPQVQRLHRDVIEEFLSSSETYDAIFQKRLNQIALGELNADEL